jgi:L-galactose dehydrogenase/L-glyceraldehyde 3-phosphate reductase
MQVSELAFGGGWVGGVLIHQEDAVKLRTLRRAVEAGINWIDTAPSYGNGQSEMALGRLLKDVEGSPHISTKVMLDTARLDDIPGEVERSVLDSLKRLDRDSVDLLQLHNPIGRSAAGNAVTVEHVLGEDGAAEALERMRDQGLTRYIGITALGDAASCRRVIDSGRFDSAQVYYNMLNPSAGRQMPPRWEGHGLGDLIAACNEQRMGVMAIRVFAAGVLASRTRHGREVVITRDSDLQTEERRADAAFAALGERYGTRAQTALRFVLANANVSCAVIGLAEPVHLEEALAGARMGALPREAMEQLDQLYADNFGL